MSPIPAGIKQTRQTAPDTPKNRKQGKKEDNEKLVGEKQQPPQRILEFHGRQINSQSTRVNRLPALLRKV